MREQRQDEISIVQPGRNRAIASQESSQEDPENSKENARCQDPLTDTGMPVDYGKDGPDSIGSIHGFAVPRLSISRKVTAPPAFASVASPERRRTNRGSYISLRTASVPTRDPEELRTRLLPSKGQLRWFCASG